MSRVDDIKEVRVGIRVPHAVVLRPFPSLYPLVSKVGNGVTLNLGEHGSRVIGIRVEVVVILDRRYESEYVLFELESNKLLASDILQCLWSTGVGLIPCLVDLMSEIVDPPSISSSERQGGTQRQGNDVDRILVEID